MIPKIIHYCWFGKNPLPPLAIKCIDSWKKFLPDYEIKEWNEDNFDVNIISYTAEAYAAKKYAFVSDYARLWILYHYGGLYFDTDVEAIKPLDEIVDRGPFMGCERDAQSAETIGVAPGLGLGVNPGLGLGVNPGLGLYKEMLELYAGLSFVGSNGQNNLKTIVEYTTEILQKHGLQEKSGVQYVAGVYIYPSEYFCPINITSKKLHITKNTYTIHHYMASWTNKNIRWYIKHCIRSLMPEFVLLWYNKVKIKKDR